MTEQYDVAAWRHHEAAELLEAFGKIDDAAYHFGVCGENALKYALDAAGVKAAWIAAGVGAGKTPEQSLRNTPMRGHFPDLSTLVNATRAEIAAYATGRRAGMISSIVLRPGFATRFSGWHINIRYADTNYVPVTAAACAGWHADADDLILALVT